MRNEQSHLSEACSALPSTRTPCFILWALISVLWALYFGGVEQKCSFIPFGGIIFPEKLKKQGAGEVNGPGWLRVAWGTSPAVHLEGMWYLWPCSCQQGRWAPGQEGRPHGRAWKVNQRGVDNALPGSPWNTGASRDTGGMCWNLCTHTAVTQACCHTASCGLLGWCFLCKHGRSGGQGAVANTCGCWRPRWYVHNRASTFPLMENTRAAGTTKHTYIKHGRHLQKCRRKILIKILLSLSHTSTYMSRVPTMSS